MTIHEVEARFQIGSQAVYDSPVEKDEINRHPELKCRLRWVPDVSK